MIFRLSKALLFPNPSLADQNGLLAIGGDLSAERLLLAYSLGIFPWYSEGEPICWYSPHERYVIIPSEVSISHSMRGLIKKGVYQVSINKAFSEVIRHCAMIRRKGQSGTWITAEMIAAYTTLHQQGKVHSVEVWLDGALIGGLYGVDAGKVFCGESMFSLATNASKLALIWLCQNGGYQLIDCQMHTAHLESMGGRFIDRENYNSFLKS
jgi:leucyl/phenylalanyl-tRNA--protein transferase